MWSGCCWPLLVTRSRTMSSLEHRRRAGGSRSQFPALRPVSRWWPFMRRAEGPGPGVGHRRRRLAPRRCRPRRLLLRSPFSLAAWNQREHQRSPPSILPQRHRPPQTLTKPPGRRRCNPQWSTPQNPRLRDPRRGAHRTPALPHTRQRCDDPLNLVWLPRSVGTPLVSLVASGTALLCRPVLAVLFSRRCRRR